MTDYLEGNGILSTNPDFDEIARRQEERRAAGLPIADDGAELMALIDGAVAARNQKASAWLQADLDGIDAALDPYLKDQLAAENAATRVTAAQKKDFERFKACCARWGLPRLPAPPQAVAVFLVEETERGAAHISRLARSISTIHQAVNFSDPCKDVLVRAILRLAREDKGNSPQ